MEQKRPVGVDMRELTPDAYREWLVIEGVPAGIRPEDVAEFLSGLNEFTATYLAASDAAWRAL